MDFSDPEVRLLMVSTIGWMLVGVLATIIIRKRNKTDKTDKGIGQDKG
tara:strand:+ start:1705 stop:1848 length:144 start_codon:yes stop_codon:yes gene_type:complete